MASRVYKAGTILTRTKNLLDVGVLKSCPLWFDVIEFLPPLNLVQHNTPPEPGKPLPIILPMDADIKKFYKNYRIENKVSMSLFEAHMEKPSPAKRFVDIQKQLETGGSKSKDKETSSLIEATTIKILKREKVKVARRKDHIIKKKNPADELVCFLNSVEK